MNQTPQTPPPIPRAEVQSAVTLVDFFHVWYRYRVAFSVGILLISLVTFVWTKFFKVKYYRAECTFIIGRQFTPESMLGLSEMEVFQENQNQQFQTVKNSLLAEQYLLSDGVILETVQQLKSPGDGEPAIDVAELLKIRQNDPKVRDALLVRSMREDLLRVSQLQTSGISSISAELPDAKAAARFVNVAMGIVQQRFIDQVFQYWDHALESYEGEHEDESELRDQLTHQLKDLNVKNFYDKIETVEQARKLLERRLNLNANRIAELEAKIKNLRQATGEETRKASQPLQVIREAVAPLKKSRPKTILSTLMAAASFTFIFLIGLVFAAAFQARPS